MLGIWRSSSIIRTTLTLWSSLHRWTCGLLVTIQHWLTPLFVAINDNDESEISSSIKDTVTEAAQITAASAPVVTGSAQGLSMLMKAVLVACILGACYAWIQAHAARRAAGGLAGRHGAYEKSSDA